MKIKSFFFKKLLVLALAGLALTGKAQHSSEYTWNGTMDKTIIQMMDSAGIPGMSVVVIRHKKLLHVGGYGLNRADSTQRVSPSTVFDAASLGKPVFAYAVLELVREGLLDLDKPLFEYLPYPDAQGDERYKKITARYVLSHRSGFPNWRPDRQSEQLPVLFMPGERFSYSGEGFVYLQKVVEKLTSKSLDKLMQERVFTPLGMSRSSYIWKEAFENDYALPHEDFGHPGPKEKYIKANSAYSLQTTAEDYGRFMLALLDPAKTSQPIIELMFAQQSRLPKVYGGSDTLSENLNWGLGMGLADKDFWHWGDNGRFKCFMIGSPATGNGVVYFTNSSYGLSVMDAFAKRFADIDQPLNGFLGYESYQSPEHIVARYVPYKEVADVVKPFLNKIGISTLKEQPISELGNKLINAGATDKALAIFKLNLAAYPHSANAMANYGYANLCMGNRTEAEKYFSKSLAINPASGGVKRILAGLQAADRSQGKTKLILKGYPKACLVTLAGSFNNWNNVQTFYTKRNGTWECYLEAEPGTYEYKIIVDGKWMLDPQNPKTLKNSEGNTNSVLVVR